MSDTFRSVFLSAGYLHRQRMSGSLKNHAERGPTEAFDSQQTQLGFCICATFKAMAGTTGGRARWRCRTTPNGIVRSSCVFSAFGMNPGHQASAGRDGIGLAFLGPSVRRHEAHFFLSIGAGKNRIEQHVDARCRVSRFDMLVFVVRDAVLTGCEDQCGRSDLGQMIGIMTGSAEHVFV